MMSLIDKVLYKIITLREQNNKTGMLDREYLKLVNPDSMLFYYGNIHSQRGQDAILAEIFRRIGINKGVFVEFGAWDGMYLSNSRFLFEKGWDGVFIEANTKRYKDLCQAYSGVPNIVKINSRVSAPKYGLGEKNLAALLTDEKVAIDTISFVSIDVDGPDLEIFTDLGLTPPVILLEGGFNFSPYFVQEVNSEIAHDNLQQPLPVIIARALEIGYTPVCFYQDTYLVRTDLIGPFHSCPTGAISLYKDAFCFMPNDYRKSLLELRAGSQRIQELEKKYFGHFSVDPMGYSEHDKQK